jgi:hypothetical protein
MTSFLIVVPVHGIRLTAKRNWRDEIANRRWTFVGASDFEDFAQWHGRDASLEGNARQIRERLGASALMLYRIDRVFDVSYMSGAYQAAEGALAALNLARLGSRSADMPLPLRRARYREACELPLAIAADRVLAVGHTAPLSWPGLLDSDHLDGPAPDAEKLLLNAESPLQRMADGAPPHDVLDAALFHSARAIHEAFQCTTIGAFVSASVSAVEPLVSDIEREPWDLRVQRLLQLADSAFRERIEQVLDARHAFIHDCSQPAFAERDLHFAAAAFAVLIWRRVAALQPRCATVSDVVYLLRGMRAGHEFAPAAIDFPGWALRGLTEGFT